MHASMKYIPGSRALTRDQSRSQSFVPLDQRSENESSGSNYFEIAMGNNRILVIRLTAQSQSPSISCYGACLKWLLQSSRFPTAGQGERSSGNEIDSRPIFWACAWYSFRTQPIGWTQDRCHRPEGSWALDFTRESRTAIGAFDVTWPLEVIFARFSPDFIQFVGASEGLGFCCADFFAE